VEHRSRSDNVKDILSLKPSLQITALTNALFCTIYFGKHGYKCSRTVNFPLPRSIVKDFPFHQFNFDKTNATTSLLYESSAFGMFGKLII